MGTVAITVVLTIEGDEQDAIRVIDRLLDTGIFQDAINDHEVSDAGPLKVMAASVGLRMQYERASAL